MYSSKLRKNIEIFFLLVLYLNLFNVKILRRCDHYLHVYNEKPLCDLKKIVFLPYPLIFWLSLLMRLSKKFKKIKKCSL